MSCLVFIGRQSNNPTTEEYFQASLIGGPPGSDPSAVCEVGVTARVHTSLVLLQIPRYMTCMVVFDPFFVYI